MQTNLIRNFKALLDERWIEKTIERWIEKTIGEKDYVFE